MDEDLKQTLAEMRQETRELLHQHVGGLRQETHDLFVQARQETHDLFVQARQETHDLFAQARQESRDLFAQAQQQNALQHVETRRHFDITVERMDHRYDAVAEAFLALDEKTDRSVRTLESDVSELKETTPKMIEYAINHHEKRRH